MQQASPNPRAGVSLDDVFMSAADVARLIGNTPATLAQWRYKGQGPASVKLGGMVRYRKSAVLTWIAEQEAASSTHPAA